MEKRKQDIVLELVSKHFGVEKDVILSKTRTRDITVAKHMFVYILREHCAMTLLKIAKEIPNYDHSMVIYGCSRMKNMILSRERPAYDVYKAILKELGEESDGEYNIHPKLIIRYPKGFNIQELIQLINSKHKNLEYELI